MSEILLSVFRRARHSIDSLQDRGSFFIVWGTIFVSIALAILLTSQRWARINLNFKPYRYRI